MSFEPLIALHSVLIAFSLIYYFKFSNKENKFFEDNYNFIKNIKSRITQEIANEISLLAIPTPKVIILKEPKNEDLDTKKAEYYEGNSNPLKGEKFKDWLDNYLKKEKSFFVLYYEFNKKYLSWRKWSKFLRYYSIFVSIIQFLLLLILLWYFLCPSFIKNINQEINSICVQNNSFVFIYLFILPIILIICGLIIICYKDSLKNKIIDKRDQYYEL